MVAAVVAAVLLMTGCDDRDEAQPSRGDVRIPGFEPYRFPDIRLPLGWRPLPGHDQLALSLAGGAIRSFDVTLAPPTGKEDQQPADAIRVASALLAETGWERQGDLPQKDDAKVDAKKPSLTDTRQRHRKGGELLDLACGYQDGELRLEYRLSSTP